MEEELSSESTTAPKAPGQRRRRDEVATFKLWLVERGGELLATTNEWELVRFRGNGIVSIIYTNSRGRARRYVGLAQGAWDAFKDKSPSYRLGDRPRLLGESKGRYLRSVVVRTIVERDGNSCFYCGDPFTDEKPPTKEHLVSKTHAGPEHISNLFLACQPHNTEAGHMSAPEKIRMRDRIRRGVGSKLLEEIAASEPGDSASPELIEKINAFLNPTRGTKA